MAEAEDIKGLEMRIARIEKLVEKMAVGREPADVSAQEIAAFRKVRDVIAADWGEFCGINDCFRCIIRCLRCVTCVRCIVRCIVECSCGPCNPGFEGGLSGGIGRFSELGG